MSQLSHLPNLAVGSPRPLTTVGVATCGVRAAAAVSSLLRLAPGNGDGPEPKGCGPCAPDPTGECRYGRRFCILPGFEGFRCCPPPPPVCGPCQRTCTRFDGTTFTQSCGATGSCCRVAG
jgi:hypothetical protein